MDQVIRTVLKAEWLKTLASSRVRRLSKEGFWIVLGQAMAVLGAVVGVRILTTVLPPETYGQLALGMTVATFANIVVLGPLSNGATRFFAPAREAKGLPGYFAAVKKLLFQASGVIILFAVLLCLALVIAGQTKWILLALAAFCFALLSGYNSVLNGMQNAARQRSVVALHRAVLSWGRFLLAGGLVLWLGSSSAIAMMGYCIATVLVLLSQRWFFRRTLKPADVNTYQENDFDNEVWGDDIVRYAWPFATWGVLGWARLASDRWAIHVFGTTEDVGFYAVLFQLGYYPITILTGLVTQLVSPVVFQRAGDASDADRLRRVYILTWKMTAGIIAATLVAVGLATWLKNAVFHMLVAEEYHSVAGLLPGMLFAAGLFAAARCCTMGIHSHLRTKTLMRPKIVLHCLGVVMNVAGAAWYGIAGLIVASIMFSILHLGWIALLSARCFRAAIVQTYPVAGAETENNH